MKLDPRVVLCALACGSLIGCVSSYTISATGTNVTIAPATSVKVAAGRRQSFTVTPDAHDRVQSAVGGTCPTGSWNESVYTTGAIERSCTLTFSAVPETFSVTASGTHVTVLPSVPQTISYGGTTSFTVTADAGDTTSTTVGGTCAAGSWSATTYTTGPITADCTVAFSAPASTFQVSASGDSNETITPAGSQTITIGGAPRSW